MKLPGGFGFPQERLVDSRLALRLKRLLGLVRAPSLETGTTVTPTVELQDYGAFLRDGVIRGGGAGARAAAAGNKPFVGLINPATSGRVIVVRTVRFGTANAGELLVRLEDGGAAGYLAGTVGLSRQQFFSGKRNEVFGYISWNDNVGGSPGGSTVGLGYLYWVNLSAQSFGEVPSKDFVCILYPGQSVYVQGAALASTVYASFEWEEYPSTDTQ